MNKFFPVISVVLLFSSCLTFNFNHVIEKFIEYKDVDFNNVKRINIITNNKSVGDSLRYYLISSYKNRALIEPKIFISDTIKDGLSNELNIHIKSFDYNIKSGFKVEKTLAFYNKIINAKYDIVLFKSGLAGVGIDLSGDAEYIIEKSYAISPYYNKEDKNSAIIEPGTKIGIKEIDNYSLYYGVCEKIFDDFIEKRLIPISRELINFKIGFNKELFKAHQLLSEGKMDEALIIWEQIYSDSDNSYYSRGIAAYNIGMYKAMEKDFKSAELYFKRYDQLEEDRIKDFIRF